MEEDKIVAALVANDSGYSLTAPCNSKPEESPAPIMSVVIEATELPTTGTAVTEFMVTATVISKDEEYAPSSSEDEVLALYDDEEETDDDHWVPRGKLAHTVSSGTRDSNDGRRDGSRSGEGLNNSNSKDKKDKDAKDKDTKDKDAKDKDAKDKDAKDKNKGTKPSNGSSSSNKIRR
ncbi:hypothetical protein DAEQUDRAFT_733435 [Daedalea quercina L-15889]|uniref:Uncharacterized protein n=1 Tax=Daedalea quercina L-15889 TaxID=1314783 RepID=A0A165KZH6_9APHY|nr:hypothetical protein DAEQUDRAFT_733435 [Daedalea quercina L-15889]